MKKLVLLKVAVGAIAIGLVVAGCYAGRVEAENLLLTPFWQKSTASVEASAETEEPCADCAWPTTTTNN